jgi:hypothetical protein
MRDQTHTHNYSITSKGLTKIKILIMNDGQPSLEPKTSKIQISSDRGYATTIHVNKLQKLSPYGYVTAVSTYEISSYHNAVGYSPAKEKIVTCKTKNVNNFHYTPLLYFV